MHGYFSLMYADITDIEETPINSFKEFSEFFVCFLGHTGHAKEAGVILWGFVRAFGR